MTELRHALTLQSFVGLATGNKPLLASDPLGYVLTTPDAAQRLLEEPMSNAPTGRYRVNEDVTETLPDGRVIQVAVKGSEMTMAEASRLGLVKNEHFAGPSEVKAEMDRVNAQAASAVAQTTGNKDAEAPSVTREKAERAAAERAASSSQESEQAQAKASAQRAR